MSCPSGSRKRSWKAIKSFIDINQGVVVRIASKLVFCFALLGLLLTIGCATTGEENISERPWNTPMSWENGIPSSMMQGR